MNKKPDILLFMSDQHGATYSSWGSVKVDTPVLDSMREQGTAFDAAYTSCPLCVPARMSMMSGLLPEKTGITGNTDTLPDTTPCFTHQLACEGYETVLIGRMHFVGKDQRHGFTKRIAPDFTNIGWGHPVGLDKEQGLLMGTTGEPWCCDIVGAGENMVNHYDDMVVDAAIKYLQEEHEKPQFIVVGTYAPHHPYITDEDLYKKYLDRVEKPRHFDQNDVADFVDGIEVITKRRKPDEVTWEVERGCLAAYCGQVERTDQLVGQVKEAFETYEAGKDCEGIFGYLSDHGDMVGEHRIFGKMTFFEKSANIPLLFTGAGIPKGKSVKEPVSIMDIGPTVCELAGTTFDISDGQSIKAYFEDREEVYPERIVVSQLVDGYRGKRTAGVMLRYQQFKYVVYHGYEDKAMLFDLENNPQEIKNDIAQYPELAKWFAEKVVETCDMDHMEQQRVEHDRNAQLFGKFENTIGEIYEERWKENPPTARGQLTIAAAHRDTMIDWTKGNRS